MLSKCPSGRSHLAQKEKPPHNPRGASPLSERVEGNHWGVEHLLLAQISVIANGGDLVTSTPVNWGIWYVTAEQGRRDCEDCDTYPDRHILSL